MTNTIKVKGMHCDACKSLIKMELEENGFEDKIERIEITGDNIGEVVISDENDSGSVKAIINGMENYGVVEG